MPAPIALVPLPRSVVWTADDPFVIGDGGAVLVAADQADFGALAATRLTEATGRPFTVGGRGPSVEFRLVEGGAAESSTVSIAADGVLVEASDPAGLWHGLATLRQVVRQAGPEVPAGRIEDAPRFGWRGLSVDIARHFFGPAELRLVVDLMAEHKLNVLHLHLSDDQGWRIDLPGRPELAARSGATAVDGDPGGFLTADDYRELIDYAALRGIRVVPEVDVPGHVNAALHAVPELTPDGAGVDVYTGIEVGFSKLAADLPATEPFLRDVFGDLAAMTPGEYLHIGGDEVHTMEPAEYARLVAMAAAAVRDAGKQVVGWQEIATTPLEPGTVVQFWDPREDVTPFVTAARAGAKLLMSPGSRAYLDMQYHEGFPLGLHWAGYVSLRDAYDWEPTTLIAGLPEDAVIGVEAAVWTETLRTLDELTTMLLPRLAAVAEVAWTSAEARGWEDFAARVAAQGDDWRARGIAFHPADGAQW
ncbi:family 20 glycosylhydrolase [Cellulomonas taurus]|uniref:family 20 glycosylhydrolase n=1 Tax=Cellulomonas taurus TaxID=2729175 RepID=UPI00145FB471|nr:family 20 glycosylhydrolase [Cellulomonas taurus]